MADNPLPVIAIPSYNRADLITILTLSYLERENYPSSKIFIFVASEEERAKYVLQIPRHLYNEIVTGVLGLKEQRQFISNYFAEAQIIVQLDDDVRRIKFLDPQMTFINLVCRGVQILESEGVGLFGVLPNSDGRKMKQNTTRHLTHILGSFFICRNHKDLVVNISDKEDFERSILYFKRYSAVARYQGAGVDTVYAGTPGGLNTPGRPNRSLSDLSYLMLNYKEFCKTIIKKNNKLDIMLLWRAKTGDPRAP